MRQLAHRSHYKRLALVSLFLAPPSPQSPASTAIEALIPALSMFVCMYVCMYSGLGFSVKKSLNTAVMCDLNYPARKRLLHCVFIENWTL